MNRLFSIVVIICLLSLQSNKTTAFTMLLPNISFQADIYSNSIPETLEYVSDLAMQSWGGFGTNAHIFRSFLTGGDQVAIAVSQDRPNAFEFEVIDNASGTRQQLSITNNQYTSGLVSMPSPTEVQAVWDVVGTNIHFKLFRNAHLVADDRLTGKYVVYETFSVQNLGQFFRMTKFIEYVHMDDIARGRDFNGDTIEETLLAINSYSTSGYPVLAKIYLKQDYIETTLLNDGIYAAITHILGTSGANIEFAPLAKRDLSLSGYITATARNQSDSEEQINADAAILLGEPTPDNDWAIRAYNTDDVSAIFVNGLQLVGTRYGSYPDSGWEKINAYWRSDQENIVTFATLNTDGPSSWGFGLKNGATDLWDYSGSGPSTTGVIYQKSIRVFPNGQLEEYSQPGISVPISGKWEVAIRANGGSAYVLIGNQLIDATTDNSEKRINISSYLGLKDNYLHFNTWSDGDAFDWKLTIYKDDVVVWEYAINQATTQMDRNFHMIVIVDMKGNVYPALDLPVDYNDRPSGSTRNFNKNFSTRITSFFDHEFPTYDADTNGFVRLYSGEKFDDPIGTRCNERYNCYSGHSGYDIDDIQGPTRNALAVYPAADGKVLNSGWSDGDYGCWVKIDHGSNWITIYGHLNDPGMDHTCPGVLVGDGHLVSQFDQIGVIGRSGNSDGPHLHFEVRHDSHPVDPSGWDSNETDPNIADGATSFPMWIFRDRGYLLADPSTGGQLTSLSNVFTLDIPAGYNENPLSFYLSAIPAVDPNGSLDVIGTAYSISAQDDIGNLISSFPADFELAFHFSPGEEERFIQDTLSIYYWNEVTSKWIVLPTKLDYLAGTATTRIDHLTRFALMGQTWKNTFMPIITR